MSLDTGYSPMTGSREDSPSSHSTLLYDSTTDHGGDDDPRPSPVDHLIEILVEQGQQIELSPLALGTLLTDILIDTTSLPVDTHHCPYNVQIQIPPDNQQDYHCSIIDVTITLTDKCRTARCHCTWLGHQGTPNSIYSVAELSRSTPTPLTHHETDIIQITGPYLMRLRNHRKLSTIRKLLTYPHRTLTRYLQTRLNDHGISVDRFDFNIRAECLVITPKKEYS